MSFFSKLTSSTENLVLTCMSLYAAPFVLMSIPSPSAFMDGWSQRLNYRLDYMTAQGEYRRALCQNGHDTQRPAILDNYFYAPPAPAAPPKPASVAATGGDIQSFEQLEKFLDGPEDQVNSFFNDSSRLERFLENAK